MMAYVVNMLRISFLTITKFNIVSSSLANHMNKFQRPFMAPGPQFAHP